MRVVYTLKGINHALKSDRSFRFQIYFIGNVVALFLLIGQPFTSNELLFIILAYALILITELQNSAFETALDRLHPERHDKIGNSKDMASGAVLIAGGFLALVLVVVWLT